MSPASKAAFLFFGEVIISYGFPLAMFMLAIISRSNFMYSGHGGFAWFVVPLCFPSVVLQAILKMTIGSAESRRWYRNFYKITIPAYVAIALPLSWAAVRSIEAAFGLQVPTWAFYVLIVSPFPWWYFT